MDFKLTNVDCNIGRKTAVVIVSITVLFAVFTLDTSAVVSSANEIQSVNDDKSQMKHRSRRTIYGRLCPKGCASCSPINGCVTCRPRNFLHVQRTRTREIGVCVASCPIGHLGVRSRHYSHCAKCRVSNCDVCLTKHYCTRCQGSLYEHRGQCMESCPNGLIPGNTSRECLPKVDCLVSEWGQWGVCAKNGRSCGATFGVQTRVRQIAQFPSSTGRKCPENTENRKCLIGQPICPAIVMSQNRHSQKIQKEHRQMRKKRKFRKRKRGKGKRRKGKKGRNRKREKLPKNLEESSSSSSSSLTTEISNQIEPIDYDSPHMKSLK